MPKLFNELRERLLRSGVAPRHVRRYLKELTDHLTDLRTAEEHAGSSRAEAEAAALVRLGSVNDLAKAMIEQRQFQSWSARVPWAVFACAPIFVLAMAYFTACFILWSGWRMFLPGANTPFIELNGLAIFYFGVGRMIYFGAPIVVGWAIGLVAARQRMKAIWPTLGLAVTAFIGGSARVQAIRPAMPGATGHVGMDFAFWRSAQDFSSGLFHILIFLSLMAMPYVMWRLRRIYFISA